MAVSKDNLIFLLVGVVAGIVIGVLIVNSSGSRALPQTVVQQQSQQPAGGSQDTSQSDGQLPEGHPPVDEAAIKQRIVEQEQILKQDPANQEAIVSLGNLNFDVKNYAESAKWYQKALEKDPENVNLITDLGSAYLWMNQTQKAVDFYNRSLSIDPKHFQTLMNLGIARMTLGDRVGAAEAWQKVVEYHPNHPEAAMLRDAIQKLKTEG